MVCELSFTKWCRANYFSTSERTIRCRSHSHSRRTFLRAAGVTLALPLFDSRARVRAGRPGQDASPARLDLQHVELVHSLLVPQRDGPGIHPQPLSGSPGRLPQGSHGLLRPVAPGGVGLRSFVPGPFSHRAPSTAAASATPSPSISSRPSTSAARLALAASSLNPERWAFSALAFR